MRFNILKTQRTHVDSYKWRQKMYKLQCEMKSFVGEEFFNLLF